MLTFERYGSVSEVVLSLLVFSICFVAYWINKGRGAKENPEFSEPAIF